MSRQPKRSLVFDISNLLFRVAAVQKHKNPFARDAGYEDLVGLCMHVSVMSIFKWYQKFKPDFVVFAFEGNNNWRKKYTADVRAREQMYKANRPVDPEFAYFYQLIDSFRETMTAHTSICCLRVDMMEADDVIAGYCQLYAAPDHEIFIVSGDKDFIGLLKLPNVKLVNPDSTKSELRNQPGDKEYYEDIDYWTFLKCIRGDMGDHVPSAFPRVRETRLFKAYHNDYERINLMNETWVEKFAWIDPATGQAMEKETTHRVGDLYEHNKILLDLFHQPEEIRELLFPAIAEQVESFGKYSHFHFLRFLDSYKLNRLKDDAIKYVDMFSNNQRFMSGEKKDAPSIKPEEAPKKSLVNFE